MVPSVSKLLISVLLDPLEPLQVRFQAMEAMSLAARGCKKMQEECARPEAIKLLLEFLKMETTTELPLWACYCLFVLIFDCESARRALDQVVADVGIDLDAELRRVSESGHWRMWTWNDAENLRKLLKYPAPTN